MNTKKNGKSNDSEQSDEMALLLRLINLLPRDGSETCDGFLSEFSDDVVSYTREISDEHFDNSFNELFSFLHLEIRNYLYEVGKPRDAGLIINKYNDLLLARDAMEHLIAYKNVPNDCGGFFQTVLPLTVSTTGRVRVGESFFIKTIDGVDVNRLRRCASCNDFFWAKQLNIVACKKSCANLRRVKKWREKQLDYELNRFRREQKRISN